MTTSKRPYAPPRKLEPNLARVLTYWQKLKRREAEMPFWDDVNVSALPRLLGKLTMIEASDKPVRFRFGLGAGGEEIKRKYAGDLNGKYLDEMEVRQPLEFLLSQCSATIESGKPTYYRHGPLKPRRFAHEARLLPAGAATVGTGPHRHAAGGVHLGIAICGD